MNIYHYYPFLINRVFMPWLTPPRRPEVGIKLYGIKTRQSPGSERESPVQTCRHASITYLEEADSDLPRGSQFYVVFRRALAALTRSAVAC
jgi:hypothetical protein